MCKFTPIIFSVNPQQDVRVPVFGGWWLEGGLLTGGAMRPVC